MKTTENYVFGGFVHESFGAPNTFVRDPNAFLYGLRANGTTNLNIFRSGGTSYDPTSQNAFYNNQNTGLIFGGGYDLYVGWNANSTSSGRSSNLCHSYDCPGNLYIHYAEKFKNKENMI
jgi:hypothetical protein